MEVRARARPLRWSSPLVRGTSCMWRVCSGRPARRRTARRVRAWERGRWQATRRARCAVRAAAPGLQSSARATPRSEARARSHGRRSQRAPVARADVTGVGARDLRERARQSLEDGDVATPKSMREQLLRGVARRVVVKRLARARKRQVETGGPAWGHLGVDEQERLALLVPDSRWLVHEGSVVLGWRRAQTVPGRRVADVTAAFRQEVMAKVKASGRGAARSEVDRRCVLACASRR